jgi:hypothetical protein
MTSDDDKRVLLREAERWRASEMQAEDKRQKHIAATATKAADLLLSLPTSKDRTAAYKLAIKAIHDALMTPSDIAARRRRKQRAREPQPHHPLRDWLNPKMHTGLSGDALIAALTVIGRVWDDDMWDSFHDDAVEWIEENASDAMLDRPTWVVDAKNVATAAILAEIAFELMMTGPWSDIALELIRRRADETLAHWKANVVAAAPWEEFTFKPKAQPTGR